LSSSATSSTKSSGFRVTITYTLYFGDADAISTPAPGIAIDLGLTQSLILGHRLKLRFKRCWIILPEGNGFSFGLRHQYPVNEKEKDSPMASFLKGKGAAVMKVCRKLNISSRVTYRNLVLLEWMLLGIVRWSSE
jgi:hypothetical protein